MHPTITFKGIGAFAAGYKNQVIITVIADLLCIDYPVIIIQVAVIAGRAYKLPVKNRHEIVIYIYVLIHTPQKLDDAFIFYAIGIDSSYYLAPLQRLFLVIIIRDR